ncbi:hypothetical protein [Sunxiuqinia indica]|uniref:hypothetical protein n=1 Tax=Sunxiuqinia indica TaxID=2692584 RepID=UPI00135CADFA|nr:hypothetical protein [Sunxiuqinia indica]
MILIFTGSVFLSSGKPEPLVTKVVGTIAAIQITAYEIWGGNGVTVQLRPWGNSYSYN